MKKIIKKNRKENKSTTKLKPIDLEKIRMNNILKLESTNLELKNRIEWENLSLNESAMHLLEQNKSNIDWRLISRNPAIFELDYDFFHERMNIIRHELMKKTWHPDRFREWCLNEEELIELC